MQRAGKLVSALLVSSVLLFPRLLWAQRSDPMEGCAGCAGCGFFIVIVPLALLALHIVLLVWVARDSKARGMDNSVVWMILVMITGLIGLVIYLLSRPEGDLVQCATCGNNRFRVSNKCPHCGNV